MSQIKRRQSEQWKCCYWDGLVLLTGCQESVRKYRQRERRGMQQETKSSRLVYMAGKISITPSHPSPWASTSITSPQESMYRRNKTLRSSCRRTKTLSSSCLRTAIPHFLELGGLRFGSQNSFNLSAAARFPPTAPRRRLPFHLLAVGRALQVSHAQCCYLLQRINGSQTMVTEV